MFEGYKFDLVTLQKEIESRGWKEVAIQAPEGLLIEATELSVYLHNEGIGAAVLVNPCYGACDLADPPAGFDGVVHFGHAPFPGQEDAMFIELSSKADNLHMLYMACKKLPENIGIVATVQHLSLIPIVKEKLEECGKTVFVGDGGGRVTYPGQVLGCNLISARNISDDVDAYVFLGSGRFHPGGVAISTGKPVFAIDPHSGIMEEIDSDRFLRVRHANIEKAKEGKRYGVMVSSKVGQHRGKLAKELIDDLHDAGKEAVLFIGDNLSPQRFMGMELDAMVDTACPRIALDDSSNYHFPVITPVELKIMLGLVAWEDYVLDELV